MTHADQSDHSWLSKDGYPYETDSDDPTDQAYVEGLNRGYLEGLDAFERARELPMNRSINTLGLDPRTSNLLLRADINTVGELLRMSAQEVSALRNVGPATLDHILARLYTLGYTLHETRVDRILGSVQFS